MMITINIYYKGENNNAYFFAKEMMASGIVNEIRKEDGNLRYEYYLPLEENGEVLLIESWRDSEALDKHHASELMQKIAQLRDKYDLHMRVFKYEGITDNTDSKYIRK